MAGVAFLGELPTMRWVNAAGSNEGARAHQGKHSQKA